MEVAVCAIAKNENLYIREWVEWYKNLGISKIFLYDNNDLDGERFEDVINDYIESDFVEVIDIRGINNKYFYDQEKINIKAKCYIDFYEEEGKYYDWIGFFDVDEYLVFNNDFNLNSFFNQDKFYDIDTILVYLQDNKNIVKSIVKSNKNILNKQNPNLTNIFRLEEDKTIYEYNINLKNYKNPNISEYKEGISICISAYKAKKYIKETLNSIVNQTWFIDNNNWECNIGIDGCLETLDYIKLIMNEYDPEHFHFYYMSKNKGTYVTSNTLMSKISKYNYILRFDADDIMNEDMIEVLMNNRKDCDIVRFYLQNFADDEYTLGDIEKTKKSYIAYGQIFINHNKFNEFGGYLPWKCSADAEFLARTKKFLTQKRLQNVLFKRRITNNSLTNDSATNDKSLIRQEYAEYIQNISLKTKSLDKAINEKIEVNNFNEIEPYELMISLTSFPDRINFVKMVLESIINTNIDQNIYKLIVVLSSEEFINKEEDLPKDLVDYCLSNNIEIIWTIRNIRSHKKLIPVIEKYPSNPILVIDDDIIRTKDWLKMFINDRRKYPEDILTMRCDEYITKDFESIHDRSNFENGVKFEGYIYHNRPSNGCGGTLYPAHTFRNQIFFNDDLFMELSPSSDEMWQYCFNIMNKQRIRRTSNLFDVESIKGTQKKSLYKENKGKYTEIMNKVLNYFPKFKSNLLELLNEEEKINNHKYRGVIALTSWKKRINTCYKTITQLLGYANNNYRIVLTLSIEEFPNKESNLPRNLLNLLKSCENFEILWVYKNYKVFKKILFAMQKYQDLPIISADDDIIYKYNYIDELYNVWVNQKNTIISEGYEIRYNIYDEIYKFSKGCATIFPPGSLLGAVKYLNNKIINTQNDDSFYGIYAHLNNINIKYLHNNINNLIENHTNNDSITSLVKSQKDFYNDKLIIYDEIKKYIEI